MEENIDSRLGSADNTERTAVLLGAGASKDAGLPLTSELAGAIVDKANEAGHGPSRGRPDWVRAINAVYAGMVGYQGARGENPRSAVNIETLISAVRLLRDRENHEVAPFVASWSAALSNFGSSNLPTQSGKAILDSVGKALSSRIGFEDRNITEAVARIARAALRPDLKEPFERAEEFILASLVELLGAHGDVSYFAPLLQLAREQVGGVDVITLNYDLTVETAAANENISVNRGVEGWRPGEYLQFLPVDGQLNLMKLHGSLDWQPSVSPDAPHSQLSPRGIRVVPPKASPETWGHQRRDLPWIVVGDREKLATDGPTLVLNFAARSALLRATHLAVAGYSFSDVHINAMIRDWLGGDSARTMSILDPHWPRQRFYDTSEDFRSALMAEYGRRFDGRGRGILARVQPVEGTTGDRLGELLSSRPSLAPDPIVTVTVTQNEDSVRFDVTWLGLALTEVSLTVRPLTEPGSNYGFSATTPLFDALPIPAETSSRGLWGSGMSREFWGTGVTVTVYAPPETVLPVELDIDGSTIAGVEGWRGTVGAA